MQDFLSLTEELEDGFDIRSDELPDEMRLCVDRIDELRRRERLSSTRLPGPTADFPMQLAIAVDPARLSEIYRLRARAFANSGWIDDTVTEVVDDFDRLPTAVHLTATAAGRLVGAMRVSIRDKRISNGTRGGNSGDRSVAMPCEREFPAQLSNLVARHDRLAEFCRVAVDPDLTNRSFRTTLYGALIRSATMVAEAARVDFALIAVHAKLSLFYQHMVGVERIAKSATYGVIAEPTHLLGAEFSRLARRSQRRNSFFHVSPDDVRLTRAALAAVHPDL